MYYYCAMGCGELENKSVFVGGSFKLYLWRQNHKKVYRLTVFVTGTSLGHRIITQRVVPSLGRFCGQNYNVNVKKLNAACSVRRFLRDRLK